MSTRISTAIAAASVALLAGGRAFGFDASTVDGAVTASNAFAFDFYLQPAEARATSCARRPGRPSR
jgi:hypothetical protein